MPTDFPAQILEAITADFVSDRLVFERTYDDLLYELEAQNDWAFENVPGFEEVSLLQLLQASTIKIKAGDQHPATLHLHHLIEYAFIEQEAYRAITTLFPTTQNLDLAPAHLPLLDAAVREHLSEQGLKALDELFERVKQHPSAIPDPLPDYRQSRFLQFGNDVHIEGDPTTLEAFTSALRLLETITDHFLEFGLWEKTPTDVKDELAYHNGWHRTELERQGKDPEATEQEITIANLRALSKRRLLAMEETGWNLTHYYRPVRFLDNLIEKALAAETALQRQAAIQAVTGLGQETGSALAQRSSEERV